MRDVIEAAERICSGATFSETMSADVEIVNCGIVHRMPSWRFNQHVTPLVNYAYDEFLIPMGYSPPLNSETMIALRNFLELRWGRLAAGESRSKLCVLFLMNAKSGCSYWRCEEPARVLGKLYRDELHVDVTEKLDFDWMLMFDVIVVQRGLFGPNKASSVHTVLGKLKAAGKKIVYEIDDDLDHIPTSNSVFFSMDPRERRLINWLRDDSDAIICSTETLRDIIGLPDKTHVLENSLDFSRYQPPERVDNHFIHLNWHGGESHQYDIDTIGKELHDFLKTRRESLEAKTGQKIIFSAMGYFPQQLYQYIDHTIPGTIKDNDYHIFSDPLLKRALRETFPDDKMSFVIKGRYDTRYIKAVDYRDFHQKLIDIEPDICICPLVPDMPFNASKSNIKWVESTLAGAACVVTQMNAMLDGRALTGPFDDVPDECVIKARTPAQMFQGVQELIVNPKKRRALWEASNRYVRERYDLRQNAITWAEAFQHIAREKR